MTGKSVFITNGGDLGETTGLGTMEVLYGTVEARPGLSTFYVRYGEWVMWVAVVAAAATLVLTRSRPRPKPEKRDSGLISRHAIRTWFSQWPR